MIATRMIDGDDWERRCLMLLSLRYGPTELVRVPSERIGDLGVEGYSRDGCVYQCYSPLEPLSVEARYAAQRAKLTEDVGKLEKNADELKALLGDCMVGRYLYMVPRFDGPRIQTHANRQAVRVREMKLQFICDDFQITVATDEAFVLERRQLANAGEIYAEVSPPLVAEPDVDEFTKSSARLVAQLNTKLAKLSRFSDEATRERFNRQLLTHYLAGEDMLERLRRDYPEIWGAVTELTQERERSLPAESMSAPAPPLKHLETIRGNYRNDLAELAGISPATASELAWSATAGWLMRCPLDFAEDEAVDA
jgi:hypothetical protein